MAIYHLHFGVISRGKGKSVVAAVAYRAGEKLVNELTDKIHDFSKKDDVIYTEILAPEGGPSWMKDRSILWNRVEIGEVRKDAQLARDVNFSLPQELSHEQNISLARGFIQKQFVDKGMVADWSYHDEIKDDGYRQPHVHVLLTMREINGDGFGLKNTEWNRKEFLLEAREAWADMANEHLAQHGYDVRIDHRTLREQGIELSPQTRIGLHAHQQAGLLDVQMASHKQIAFENGEKLLAEPELVLQALSLQHATFSNQQIDNYLFRNSDTREQFQALQAKVLALPELVTLSAGDDGKARYTTQEMLALEQGLIGQVASLVAAPWGRQAQFCVDGLSEEKVNALSELDNGIRIACLQGFAGSGKSSLLSVAREGWEAAGYQLLGMSLAGIAAEQLQAASGIESRTIASFLYALEKSRLQLDKQHILVLDEAGMIGTQQMAELFDAIGDSGAKLVLVGDMHQLPAIEAGAPFRAICEQVNGASLETIVRQHDDWQIHATQALAEGHVDQALKAYLEHDSVHGFESHQAAMEVLVEDWREDNFHSSIILAYTRADVATLQEMARDQLKLSGILGHQQLFELRDGDLSIAEHERVMFLANDRELGVRNGSLGTVLGFENDYAFWVHLDKQQETGERLLVDTREYDALSYGYAATIHKAQGMTVDAAYVLVSPHMNREAAYVAGSRHSEQMDWYWGKDTMGDERHMEQLLSRQGAKDNALDYQVAETPTVELPTISIDQLSPQEKLDRAQETIELARVYLHSERSELMDDYHALIMDSSHDEKRLDQLSVILEKNQSALNILDNYWVDINLMNDHDAMEEFWRNWESIQESMGIDLTAAKTMQENQMPEQELDRGEFDKPFEGPDLDDYEMEI